MQKTCLCLLIRAFYSSKMTTGKCKHALGLTCLAPDHLPQCSCIATGQCVGPGCSRLGFKTVKVYGSNWALVNMLLINTLLSCCHGCLLTDRNMLLTILIMV